MYFHDKTNLPCIKAKKKGGGRGNLSLLIPITGCGQQTHIPLGRLPEQKNYRKEHQKRNRRILDTLSTTENRWGTVQQNYLCDLWRTTKDIVLKTCSQPLGKTLNNEN